MSDALPERNGGRGLWLGSAALAPLALWLVVWFSLNSTAMASAVQTALDRETFPGAFDVRQVEWGPHPFEVRLYGVVWRDRSGTPVLEAARVRAIVDPRSLDFSKERFGLTIERVEVDDFELTLEWDRFKKLGLTYGFRKRTFGEVTTKPPPTEVALRLSDIVLRRGTLHLRWPAFGFTFLNIHTRGRVETTGGTLAIQVAALDASEGAAFVLGIPEKIRSDVAGALPANDAARRTPPGLRIPFSGPHIRDFGWQGDGFLGKLSLDLAGRPLEASVGMGFPEKPDITRHTITVDLSLPAAVVRAASGGRVDGDTRLHMETEGEDLAARWRVGPAVVGAVRTGRFRGDRLAIGRVEADLRGGAGTVTVQATAAHLETPAGMLRDARLDLAATWRVPGTPGVDVVQAAARNPISLITFIAGGGKGTAARLSVATLEAAEARRGERRLEAVTLRDAVVDVVPGHVAARVGHAEARGWGAASGSFDGRPRVALFSGGVEGPLRLDLSLVDVPRDRLEPLLGAEALPAGPGNRVTARLQIDADASRPRVWTRRPPEPAP